MVIMPFAGYETWPELIDREVFPVEIGAIPALILSFAVTLEVEGSDTYGPDTCRSEQGKDQWGTPYQVKYSPPKAPVEKPADRRPGRCGNRTPFLVLRISIGFDTTGCHHPHNAVVFVRRQMSGNGLVVYVREEAI